MAIDWLSILADSLLPNQMAYPYSTGTSPSHSKRSPPNPSSSGLHMGPPPYPHSYPAAPQHSFYASQDHSPVPSVPYGASQGGPGPSTTAHHYATSALEQSHECTRPSDMNLTLPPPSFADLTSMHTPMTYMPPGMMSSPYQAPSGHVLSSSSAGSVGMSDYFPPFGAHPQQHQQSDASHIPSQPFSSPGWTPGPSYHTPRPLAAPRSQSGPASGAKTSRQQFTACGACRHRRVKCDLKEKQDVLERNQQDEDERAGGSSASGSGPGPIRTSTRRRRAICSNCEERGTNCVDEYAPLKAAKQLRRGKRISEIEMLYGKTAASAAVASNPDESSMSDGDGVSAKGGPPAIPDLTREFFESPFFRRFQIQRPILDPQDIVPRYLSQPQPSAAAMGPEGAVLCHILYAWAVSYGVDEHGELDVMEGGQTPMGLLSLMTSGNNEMRREEDRRRRFAKMRAALEIILREIDECGIMRKPSWNGVQALLLVLPLTENVSSPLERLAMYEAALNQAYSLCSFAGIDYDGMPSRASGVNGGSDVCDAQDVSGLRVRIYWYAFVHEGITTGLKGGRLHLDDEDLETINDSIHSAALVVDSQKIRWAVRYATAPINLALACRLINKALTGPSAKRRIAVNAEHVKEAWEALERSWEEFDSIKYMVDITGPYSTQDEVVRFADGWKIFLFEAQNIIRRNLEERLAKFGSGSEAYIVDGARTRDNMQREMIGVQHLLSIARGKCEVQTKQIMEIVRRHVGSRFFEWDASLVRDGTYYAAMLLAGGGGSDEDISYCLQALNELRWAHAKAWDRSADLRREWQESRASLSPDNLLRTWSATPYLPPISLSHSSAQNLAVHDPSPNTLEANSSLSGSPYASPDLISPTFDPLGNAHAHPLGAYTAGGGGERDRQAQAHAHMHVNDMVPKMWARADEVGPGGGVGAGTGTMIQDVGVGVGVGLAGGGGGSGYAVYGSMPGPPPLAGSAHAQQGHYVLQPDGSQAFVTYG